MAIPPPTSAVADRPVSTKDAANATATAAMGAAAAFPTATMVCALSICVASNTTDLLVAGPVVGPGPPAPTLAVPDVCDIWVGVMVHAAARASASAAAPVAGLETAPSIGHCEQDHDDGDQRGR